MPTACGTRPALTPATLRERTAQTFGGEAAQRRFSLTLIAFGFKYGLPLDADMVLDVRFLPNPFYVEGLRGLSGADPEVADYLEALPATGEFLARTKSLLEFLIPHYASEGKSHLTVAVGCTGGRHRSVYVDPASCGRCSLSDRGARARHRRPGRQADDPRSACEERAGAVVSIRGSASNAGSLIAILGALFFVNGLDRWLTAEGAHVEFNTWLDSILDDYMPIAWLQWILMGAGVAMVIVGMRQWMHSIVDVLIPDRKNRIVDALLQSRLRSGYRIVALGGGTGLSTLLRGLKRFTLNLTAIVTVSDDGGSSGRLQKELGVLPPGDIRNCLVALADDEALVTALFRYRFNEGTGLSGHSFGNLFLAAMTGITGKFDAAVRESSRVLNVKGRVLPATLSVAKLRATMADGAIVEGESAITKDGRAIEDIALDPPHPAPLGEVIEAIRTADAIVLGPGSLYTSIIPNLLVDRIAREIEQSSAVKIYVCNVMTQPGETDGFTASRHLEVLLGHTNAKVCDYVVVNSEPPQRLRDIYAEEGQVWVVPDLEEIAKLGVRPIIADVIGETTNVRHDPEKLAQTITNLIDAAVAERATFVKRTPTTPPTPTAPRAAST